MINFFLRRGDMKCDFCGGKCDGKNIIRSTEFHKKDGSDTVVCGDCLNLYAHGEWDKLIEKLKVLRKEENY